MDDIKPITLTFSKKNKDVARMLSELAESGEKKTDILCNAVRYLYNRGGECREEDLKEYIDKRIQEVMEEVKKSKNANTIVFDNIIDSDLEED